eukprot:6423965-Pyramimonas_sp.AAC.1
MIATDVRPPTQPLRDAQTNPTRVLLSFQGAQHRDNMPHRAENRTATQGYTCVRIVSSSNSQLDLAAPG